VRAPAYGSCCTFRFPPPPRITIFHFDVPLLNNPSLLLHIHSCWIFFPRCRNKVPIFESPFPRSSRVFEPRPCLNGRVRSTSSSFVFLSEILIAYTPPPLGALTRSNNLVPVSFKTVPLSLFLFPWSLLLFSLHGALLCRRALQGVFTTLTGLSFLPLPAGEKVRQS